MNYLNEQNILIFLIQVFILLGFSRGLGEVFRRFRQPTLTAEILVGIILGPSILGRFFPAVHQMIFPANPVQQNMLETVAWLGVFFLLLEAGLEIDFTSAWQQRGDAFKIAVTGIVVPMAIVFGFSLYLPDSYLIDPHQKIIFCLFMATVMSITALTIATRTLHDLGLLKTDLGILILSALSINDILGWLIFTLVLIFFSSGAVVLGKVLFVLAAASIFISFCLTLGKSWTNQIIFKIKSSSMPEPSSSLTFVCLLGLLCGAITQGIGIHALIGFLIAGIMAGGAKALSERTRHVISQMVFAIFVPLFFTGIGLKIDFIKNFDLFLSLFISILSIAAKFYGAWLGASLTKQSKDNRWSIAIAHTPGGMMEIVVGILALQAHLISEIVFVAIVFSAILSSVILGPWLNYSIHRRKEISIIEFFSKRFIIDDIIATHKEAAIKEICELASLEQNMPSAESIQSAVVERENTIGTALEEGLAIPHARFLSLRRPVIVFGRSIKGIDWDSPDGKLTHFIFLILIPERDPDIQVQILRVIVKAFANPELRDELFNANDKDNIWSILQHAFTAIPIVRKKS